MAKNNKENKKATKKPYKNPASTTWGKVLIAVLTLGMVAAALVGLVFAFIDIFTKV